MYALDLPGHGKSEGVGEQTISGYANQVVRFMDAVGIRQAVLVGHSLGGAVALHIAFYQPERAQGLCLLASGAKLRVAPVILEISADPSNFAQVAEMIREVAYSPQTDSRLAGRAVERFLETRPEVLHGDFLACDGFDMREQLVQIRQPALILVGSDDRMTPPAYSQYLASKMVNARLQVIENAGHMLIIEKPRQVAAALVSFLDTTSFTPLD